MIKVLVITTTNLDLDGITNVILNYYRAINKGQYILDFVAQNNIREELQKEFDVNGSKFFKVEGRTKKPIEYIKRLRSIIRQNNYDVIHAHGNSSTLFLEMFAGKKENIKIRIPHSHNTTCKYRLVDKLLRKLFYQSYTDSIACGEEAGKWLYGDRNFEVVNNGIDYKKYRYNKYLQTKYRIKYNLNLDKTIGHIGCFNEQKNQKVLIEIFEEIYKLDCEYKLILIGEGPLKKECEKLVEEKNLEKNIIFLGKCLNANEILQAIDIMIMPSRYEGVPLTLIEAQIAGLKCFASTNISSEVVVSNLVNFIDISKNAKIIAKEVLEKVKELNIEKEVNYLVDDKYNIEKNVSKLEQIYSKGMI